jgi:hypothetical protein
MPSAVALAANPQSAVSIYCSFCLKREDEVSKLIDGQGRIFICDECVDRCVGIIEARPAPKAPIPAERRGSEQILELLSSIEETIRGKSNQLQGAVDILRGRGVSWAEIGEQLNISRQTAWERFSHAGNQ